MGNVKALAYVIVFFVNFHQCFAKNYSDYIIYNVQPTTKAHIHFLDGLLQNRFLDVIFINYPVISEITQVLVNRGQEHIFAEKLHYFKINSELLFHDAQQAFELQLLETRRQDEVNVFNRYNTLEQVYDWVRSAAANHTDLCHLESIGKTFEGRDILALAIKQPSNKKYKSYKVIVEGNIHGNEWLSSSYVIFFIHNLLKNEPPYIQLKKRFFWYFIPVLNPDGYVYSMKEDRLWVKNRRKIDDKLIGVNLNRNFDYNFGHFDASNDPISPVYHGESPFSELESKALRTFVQRKQEDLMFYFSFHGHGQKFILPFSDNLKHLVNFHEVQAHAKKAITSIENKFAKRYKVGTAGELLGKKYSGDSASWVKKTFNVPYVVTVQLRDDGEFGPTLPSSQIEPACQEMLAGVLELMTATGKLQATSVVVHSSATSTLLNNMFYSTLLNVVLTFVGVWK